jgi:hypothetical protein
MNVPALIAASVAIICTLVLTFASEIYDFDLWLYRKLGWTDLANRWERRKTWWLPLCRIVSALFIIAATIVLYLSKT